MTRPDGPEREVRTVKARAKSKSKSESDAQTQSDEPRDEAGDDESPVEPDEISEAYEHADSTDVGNLSRGSTEESRNAGAPPSSGGDDDEDEADERKAS